MLGYDRRFLERMRASSMSLRELSFDIFHVRFLFLYLYVDLCLHHNRYFGSAGPRVKRKSKLSSNSYHELALGQGCWVTNNIEVEEEDCGEMEDQDV